VTAVINRRKIKTEITQNNTPPQHEPRGDKKNKQMCTVLNFTEIGIIRTAFLLHNSRKNFHAEHEIRKRYGRPENTLQLTGYSTPLQQPIGARSKAWVCGRWPAEIVGSKPTGGTDVCLL
jgi:hypothetical protein